MKRKLGMTSAERRQLLDAWASELDRSELSSVVSPPRLETLPDSVFRQPSTINRMISENIVDNPKILEKFSDCELTSVNSLANEIVINFYASYSTGFTNLSDFYLKHHSPKDCAQIRLTNDRIIHYHAKKALNETMKSFFEFIDTAGDAASSFFI